MKVGIFSTPEGYEKQIVSACKELGLTYEVIDIFSVNWYQEFNQADCDGYILRPPTKNSLWKNTYLKRLLLIQDRIEGVCVPTFNSIFYYESKIMMADFFEINKIPLVPSMTFFNFIDAWRFVKKASLPKVVKSDGGSGGKGVKIINSKFRLQYQVIKSFFTRNVFRGFNKGNTLLNLKKIFYPWVYFNRTGYKYYLQPEVNQGYFHVQDAIDVKFEWRIVKIGDSYFGHQKIADDRGMHSGTKKKGWYPPPVALLDLVRSWCEKLNLNSMSFDIFETSKGEYLVNEMQVVFGTSTPHQMYINGVPGRYRNINEEWVFEEGDYCQHGCNILRLQNLMRLLSSNCNIV